MRLSGVGRPGFRSGGATPGSGDCPWGL